MIRREAKIMAGSWVLALSMSACPSFVFAKDGSQELECFSVAQTRREIAQHKLADPFPSMQAASSSTQAEALSARLCRNGDLFLYEISLLRRDGRIVKTLVNAVSGKPHPARIEQKPEPRAEH